MLEMDQFLARFRDEYITILGSNTKALTLQDVYDAVTEVYKAQLKAFHLFGKALELKLTGHEDKIRKLVKDKMDEIIPSQVQITSKFKHFTDQMSRMDLTTIEKEVKNLKQSFISLHIVQALTSLVKSQQTDIQTLVDSHKHLQMQNFFALGGIMGKLNILLPALPEQIRPELPTPLLMPVTKTKGEIEARIQQSRDAKSKSKEFIKGGQSSSAQVDVVKERLLRAVEGPNQDQKLNDLLAELRVSLQHNYMAFKKALGKNINFIRAVVVKVDNFLEKRIVMNINDGGVDRCLQVTLPCLQTLRASELDVMIDRVNPVIQEDTQLFQELKKAQIAAFPETYLYPHKGVVYVCPITNQARHLIVPKYYVRSNMKLIMTLQSDLKHKKNKKQEDVEMIRILDRYLVNANTMLPNNQYNLRKDGDDDE
ncbi:hypothetical protein AgCh_009630 [Apium graveolens]